MASVLVGCPTSDAKEYCLKEYLESLRELSFKGFDVCLEDNSKESSYYKRLKEEAEKWEKQKGSRFFVIRSGFNSPDSKKRISDGRNKIRELALNQGYEWFFSLEQDVIAPSNAIERLLENKKEIVSGVYLGLNQAMNQLNVFATKYLNKERDEFEPLNIIELMPSRLISGLRSVGLGCCLMHKSVLEKVSFRFEPKSLEYDDIWFSLDAQKAGFSLNLDSSVLCKHLFRYNVPGSPKGL